MRYVLDACVALKWVLTEIDSDRAIRILDDHRRGVHQLIAPEVFEVEIAHGLAKAERKGLIAPPEGLVLLTRLLVNLPALVPNSPLVVRAFQIASEARIAVYDCLYVALAEREGCELVTSDEKLVRNLGGRFPMVRTLASV